MFTGSKRLLLVVLFTVVLIAMVNLVWWLFYDRTERQLDQQLSRRLSAVASTGAVTIEPDKLLLLSLDDFDSRLEIEDLLEGIRAADSLSEVFIIDEDYRYLATTLVDSDTTYFLAGLNDVYIDSLFYGYDATSIASTLYRTGDLYLKSAFVPLYDGDGLVAAVLGVEASVDYFDALADLRRNLYLSSAISIIGGLLFGLLFILLQRRLNAAQRVAFLSETHAHLGRMVAVVSHEIKNPLMIMRASAERLAKKSDAPEAGFLTEEIDRLDRIVTGYLDFARGSGESFHLAGYAPEKIDMAEFIANLKKHFEDNYPDHEVVWIEQPVGPQIILHGYRQPLRQLLLNLLINGAESCRAVSRPIELGLSVAGESGRVIIGVIDHGAGLKKKELAKLFEPFHTTRRSGSGLGLYLSKKIVEEMGGRIHIESVKDQRTEVIINLPDKVE